MAIELSIETEYEGSGGKRIYFSDLRATYNEIIEKGKADDVDTSFFTFIMRKALGLSKAAVERVNNTFAHYCDDVQAAKDASKLLIVMKEIASMDPDLERRIKRRMEQKLNNLAGLMNVNRVIVGKNPEGHWVVKIAVVTEHQPVPDVREFNSFDEETNERITWGEPFQNKEQALYYSMWLAGALNVRHEDEDDLPK